MGGIGSRVSLGAGKGLRLRQSGSGGGGWRCLLCGGLRIL